MFIAPEDDHLRTRLTHAVEVAQIATGIAARREPVRPAHRGDRARARLRPRPGRSPERGGVLAVRPRRLRPRGLRRRRHARAAEPVRGDARRCAQPFVAPSGAVDARGRGRGVGRSHRVRLPRLRGRGARRHPRRRPTCPIEVAAVVGRDRSRQIGAFVHAVLDAIDRTGHVGMTEPAASALARVPRVQLRPDLPAARGVPAGRQGRRPAAGPRRLLRRRAAAACTGRRVAPGSPEAAAVAVRYVSGMTDRYALGLGVECLGWRPEDLPRGV